MIYFFSELIVKKIAIVEKAIPFINIFTFGLSNVDVNKLNKQIESITKERHKRINLAMFVVVKFFIFLVFFVCLINQRYVNNLKQLQIIKKDLLKFC